MTTLRSALATTGLVTALALPVAAPAATAVASQPQTYHLQTRLVDKFHPGEYDGYLNLTVNPNGIVQGTYRDADAGGVKVVSGGLEHDGHIWLDIGTIRPLHLTGTFKNGQLDTVATIPGPDVYRLLSTNVPNG